jgi:hypothetical protein
MRVWANEALSWKGHRLFLKEESAPLAEIVPDTQWRGMWRVLLPDGSLSDIVNITRAQDAARSLALLALNRPKKAA